MDSSTLATQLHLSSGKPHLVAVAVVLGFFDAQFILLDAPLARALAAHGKACQRAVGRKNVGPMNLIGNLHAGQSGLDLRAAELLEFFRCVRSNTEKEQRDDYG